MKATSPLADVELESLWATLGEDVDDQAYASGGEVDADDIAESMLPYTARGEMRNDVRRDCFLHIRAAVHAMAAASVRWRDLIAEEERLAAAEEEQDRLDMEATYKTLGPEL